MNKVTKLEKAKNAFSKGKAVAVVSALALAANVANAAPLSMDAQGKVTGDIISQMGAVNTVAGAIFTALASIIVVKWAIAFVRRG